MERAIDTGRFNGWTSLVRAAAVVTVAAFTLASCATVGDNPKAAIGGSAAPQWAASSLPPRAAVVRASRRA